MGTQKMLCFKQGDQVCQSGLRSKVLSPRCVLLKPSPPILLPLTVHSRKPLPQRDLLEKTQKNREPDHLKPPIIKLRPQGMDCSTVRTPIPLQTQGLGKIIKIPPHIPMPPQSWTPAPRTPRGTRPRILLSELLQELDIKIAIQYQVSSLWGITGDSSPGRGIHPQLSLFFPFNLF